MTAVALKAGDMGCDMAGYRLSTAAKVAAFKAAGGKFVLRYSAGAASDPANPSHHLNVGKLITPAEHKSLTNAGIDIIANDEWYAGRMKEGATAGKADGAAAYALWHSCGHAKGSRVYVSLDQDATTRDVPALAAYLKAHQAAMGNGYYIADFYGGTPIIRALVAAHLVIDGWRPNAGSWSDDGLPYQPDLSTAAKRAAMLAKAQKATPAHIWQTGNYWFAKQADEDMILRVPVGSHFEALAPVPPKPTPKPTYPAWPWGKTDTLDVLGNWQNPSHNVHGGDPRFDGHAIVACIVAVETKLYQLGLTKVKPGGKWTTDTDKAVLAWRAKYDPSAKGVKTLGDAGYVNLMKTVKK